MLSMTEIDWPPGMELCAVGYPNIAQFTFAEFSAEAVELYHDFKDWMRTEVTVPQPDQDIVAVMMQLAYVKHSANGGPPLADGITDKIHKSWDRRIQNDIVPEAHAHPVYPLFMEAHEEGIATDFLYRSRQRERDFVDRYFAIPEADRARDEVKDAVGHSVGWMTYEITPFVTATIHELRYKTKRCDDVLDFPYRLPQWGLIAHEHPIQQRLWMLKAYVMSKDSRGTPVCLNFED